VQPGECIGTARGPAGQAPGRITRNRFAQPLQPRLRFAGCLRAFVQLVELVVHNAGKLAGYKSSARGGMVNLTLVRLCGNRTRGRRLSPRLRSYRQTGDDAVMQQPSQQSVNDAKPAHAPGPNKPGRTWLIFALLLIGNFLLLHYVIRPSPVVTIPYTLFK